MLPLAAQTEGMFHNCVADFTWFYCSTMILTFLIFLFLWEAPGIEIGSRLAFGRREGREQAGGSVASLAKLNTLPLFSLPGVDSAPAP